MMSRAVAFPEMETYPRRASEEVQEHHYSARAASAIGFAESRAKEGYFLRWGVGRH